MKVTGFRMALRLVWSLLCAETAYGFAVQVVQIPDKEPSMVFLGCAGSRVVTAAIAVSAVSGALLFAAVGSSSADPEPAAPNCTAGDMAGVAAGVAASTSAYLFGHPDVNDFFTGLKGLPRSEMRERLQQYMDANPQTHADLQGIRQPMTDFRARCGVPAPTED
jgi:hemophore-related protein